MLPCTKKISDISSTFWIFGSVDALTEIGPKAQDSINLTKIDATIRYQRVAISIDRAYRKGLGKSVKLEYFTAISNVSPRRNASYFFYLALTKRHTNVHFTHNSLVLNKLIYGKIRYA